MIKLTEKQIEETIREMEIHDECALVYLMNNDGEGDYVDRQNKYEEIFGECAGRICTKCKEESLELLKNMKNRTERKYGL